MSNLPHHPTKPECFERKRKQEQVASDPPLAPLDIKSEASLKKLLNLRVRASQMEADRSGTCTVEFFWRVVMIQSLEVIMFVDCVCLNQFKWFVAILCEGTLICSGD